MILLRSLRWYQVAAVVLAAVLVLLPPRVSSTGACGDDLPDVIPDHRLVRDPVTCNYYRLTPEEFEAFKPRAPRDDVEVQITPHSVRTDAAERSNPRLDSSPKADKFAMRLRTSAMLAAFSLPFALLGTPLGYFVVRARRGKGVNRVQDVAVAFVLSWAVAVVGKFALAPLGDSGAVAFMMLMLALLTATVVLALSPRQDRF